MQGIRYVNSTGLGSLVRLADQLESGGGGFALVKIHPKVKVVFNMLGLNAFFKIFGSKEEALSFFSNGEVAASEPKQSTRQVAEPPPPPPPSPSQTHQSGRSTGIQQRPPQPQTRRQQTSQSSRMHQPPIFQPRAITCQSCGVTLKISQPGTFKCSRCYTIFNVQPTGQVQFQKQQQKASPLQMNLNCQNETKEALLWFLAAIAKYHSFTPQRTQVLQNCINEIVTHITRDAYGGNMTSTYSVLIAAINNEINLKFADHGRTFPANAHNMFQYTKQNMRVFDLKPHPQSGNIITLKMTAF